MTYGQLTLLLLCSLPASATAEWSIAGGQGSAQVNAAIGIEQEEPDTASSRYMLLEPSISIRRGNTWSAQYRGHLRQSTDGLMSGSHHLDADYQLRLNTNSHLQAQASYQRPHWRTLDPAYQESQASIDYHLGTDSSVAGLTLQAGVANKDFDDDTLVDVQRNHLQGSLSWRVGGRSQLVAKTLLTRAQAREPYDEYQIAGGVRWNISEKSQFHLLGGTAMRTYQNAQINAPTSYTVDTGLTWQPTSRSQIRASLQRGFDDSSQPQSHHSRRLRADVNWHEKWSSTLSTDAQYALEQLQHGEDAQDTQTAHSTDLKADYQIAKDVSINAQVGYEHRQNRQSGAAQQRRHGSLGLQINF